MLNNECLRVSHAVAVDPVGNKCALSGARSPGYYQRWILAACMIVKLPVIFFSAYVNTASCFGILLMFVYLAVKRIRAGSFRKLFVNDVPQVIQDIISDLIRIFVVLTDHASRAPYLLLKPVKPGCLLRVSLPEVTGFRLVDPVCI